jgi:hypothetical protein
VLSVRTTISVGVSEVRKVIVSPFRALIKPSTFVDWAETRVLSNASTASDRATIDAILT